MRRPDHALSPDLRRQITSAADDFRARLDGLGDPQTKAWWEAYMKHVIAFRGIKTARLRPVLEEWWEIQSAQLPERARPALAYALFDSPWSEDKLAGVLAFEKLAPALEVRDLAYFEALFRRGLLFEWNNVDWLCVKALDKLVRRGVTFARPIAGWTADEAAPLWQRRAGAVAFVNLARRADRPPSSPALVKLMWAAARANAHSPERFLQTSVGWLVRELSRVDRAAAAAFARRHRARLSREALRYIVEKMPSALQRELLEGQGT